MCDGETATSYNNSSPLPLKTTRKKGKNIELGGNQRWVRGAAVLADPGLHSRDLPLSASRRRSVLWNRPRVLTESETFCGSGDDVSLEPLECQPHRPSSKRKENLCVRGSPDANLGVSIQPLSASSRCTNYLIPARANWLGPEVKLCITCYHTSYKQNPERKETQPIRNGCDCRFELCSGMFLLLHWGVLCSIIPSIPPQRYILSSFTDLTCKAVPGVGAGGNDMLP